MTFCATLPSTRRSKKPFLRMPTTMMSAPRSWASATIASAGCPDAWTSSTSRPALGEIRPRLVEALAPVASRALGLLAIVGRDVDDDQVGRQTFGEVREPVRVLLSGSS